VSNALHASQSLPLSWSYLKSYGLLDHHNWTQLVLVTNRSRPTHWTPAIIPKIVMDWQEILMHDSIDVVHTIICWWKFILPTSALKDIRDPLDMKDLCSLAIEDSKRHTIETHWFLFRESPTYTILLPLSLSSIPLASNLFHQHNNSLYLTPFFFFLLFSFFTLKYAYFYLY